MVKYTLRTLLLKSTFQSKYTQDDGNVDDDKNDNDDGDDDDDDPGKH